MKSLKSFKSFSNSLSLNEEFLKESYEELLEKLIAFGGQTNPKFGNIVIMAGGMASGKGFIKDNLIGVDGYMFDPDALKTLVSKAPKLVASIKKKHGIDVIALSKDMKNPENPTILHNLIGKELNLGNRRLEALYKSILSAHPDRKPNIIFDFSLQKLNKLDKTIDSILPLGYKKENIHIVWVVNDVEVASVQNIKRSRTAPDELLRVSHAGASQSMKSVISMGKKINRYLDGDIVLAFNKVNVDNSVASGIRGKSSKFEPNKLQGPNLPVMTKRGMKKVGAGSTGSYLKDAEYVYIKRKGKAVTSVEDLSKSVLNKIKSYVPNPEIWQ